MSHAGTCSCCTVYYVSRNPSYSFSKQNETLVMQIRESSCKSLILITKSQSALAILDPILLVSNIIMLGENILNVIGMARGGGIGGS